ncbi:protein serine/threonine phosphatase 2C [Dichomitus squalens]|uniref:Protein serine/threonine phosphatase 2C n=1 Tax=Dichomitus squalens TaxID=114155 RepID=A0A4Q9MQR9_9APHY|nr:protein serine/threonine phosphatase 2C [Dichomitus squalens]
MAHPQIINLTPATNTDQQRALDEVRDFALTDMDRGGDERWAYRMLQEPALSEELTKLAEPRTSPAGTVDSVSFQPCKTWHYRTQDRYRVEEWPLSGGTWTYAAVYDGHMNHDCVDYVSTAFGPHLRGLLDASLRSRPSPSALSALVSNLLRQTLEYVDQTMTSDFLALFPRELDAVSRLNPTHVRNLVNDKTTASSSYHKTARAFGGSTALVTLVDPTRSHLWVANVGDCVAVLAEKDRSGKWRGSIVNSIHNGSNPGELARIRAEHPGEPDCVWNNRVLGFLAPTRSLGDVWLKLPAVYAELVFKYMDADWFSPESMQPHVPRIRTPPYLSNTPDVYHYDFSAIAQKPSAPSQRALILCSDGLTDLYDGYTPQEMADEWVQVIGRELDSSSGPNPSRPSRNLALSLLREAIGGSDTQLVSRNMTVEMEERWMDDTTILVQRLP